MSLTVAIGPSSFAAKDDTPMRMLEDAGVVIKPNPFGRRLTEEEIMAHLEGVDGLIAGLEPLNRKVLTAAPGLKAIARVGIGMDNVDSESAAELGIKVSNTPDGPTRAVAELTMTCMLALSRGLLEINATLHQGDWNKVICSGLWGSPVLFIGFGRIGRAVAGLAHAFGARVLVCDPAVTPESLQPNEKLVSLEEGLSQSRVITLHAAGSDCILDRGAFQKMQEGVILLNSARAGLVDEGALIAALASGKVGGAWFDAFWREPYQGELQRFPNVLLTPHVCTYTTPCRLGMETEAVANLLRDLRKPKRED
ncbi:MAG: phosphoglycerate dehydrogenase [Desulfatirhabdiaceae bacterium]